MKPSHQAAAAEQKPHSADAVFASTPLVLDIRLPER
jgi:hypothetical protein